MDPLRVKSFLLLLLLGLLSILHAEQPLKSSILFHPVSLYAEPIHGSPLVITLEEGKKISFQKLEKGWCKVDFSGEIDAWVASCFLDNGRFTNGVIFRTNPTAAASAFIVKESFSGKKAEILETDTGSFWKKVRLKSDFTGYTTLAELENSLKQKVNGHKIKSFSIISTAVGRLLPLEKPFFQAAHKLTYKVNDTEYLVAYVIPDKVNLKLWEDWVIYISGESLWNKSVFTPFMKGENIFPAYR